MASRKKIVRVLELISALDMGGAERMLFALVDGFPREKYEFLVCCLKDEGLVAGRMREKGIAVVNLSGGYLRGAGALGKLISLLRKEKIDLVHTHLAAADILGTLGGRICGVPVISTRHNTYERWQGSFLLSLLYRRILAGTVRVVAVSEAVKSHLTIWGKVPSRKILVIPNGIDLDQFHPARAPAKVKEALGLPRNSRLVGTVGRLDPLKGQGCFLEAAREVSDSHPGVYFLIVGDGPERGKLERRARELRLTERVIFTGWREDIAEILSALAIFVLPSFKEGLGIAAMEAMACVRPVVASGVDGLRELVVEGESGILVRPGHGGELRDAILLLLRDKELALRMGTCGQERVKEKYDLADCLESTEKLYRDHCRR